MKRRPPQVNIFNKHCQIQLDTSSLHEFGEKLVRRLEVDKSFSVALISDREMQRFNREFANKDRPTDVLSFPDREDDWPTADELHLGDILISLETAARQKRDDLIGEVKLLILHGLLHLLGYDHEKDQGQMEALELQLRKEFQLC